MALHKVGESFCQTNRAAGFAKTWTLASCLDEEGGNKGAKEGVRRIPKPWLQIDFDSLGGRAREKRMIDSFSHGYG